MIWILVICILLIYFYITIKRKQSYWEDKGIKYLKPKFLFGSMEIIRSKCFGELLKDLYDAFPEERYYGAYFYTQPFLIIKDPQLLKLIMVKEFDHFVDHRTVTSAELDPIWGKNLINSEGERWRDLRATLSPSFTGSKMRIIFNFIDESAQQFIQYFQEDKSEVIELEMKDALSRYSIDVIATTAFGLKIDSLRDRNNEFYLMAKNVNNLTPLRLLRFMLYTISPTFMKLSGIKVIPPHITKFFSNLITDTVKTREEQKIVRPDMLHLLMEARRGSQQQEDETSTINEGFATVNESSVLKQRKKIQIDLEDIIAQAFIFFVAGSETTSALLSWTLYELALQPEIQDRLRQEIQSVEGKITYEKVLSLKYLDMVISESLRKWPPAVLMDRKVTKPFTIQPERPEEKPLDLEVGSLVLTSLLGLHRDPKYYPDPEKFDPERFSDDNKHRIVPFTYTPFGVGPRNCIGSRFALLESKLLLFYILKNFEVVPVKRTMVPVVLDKSQFALVAKGGMWLGLKKIH